MKLSIILTIYNREKYLDRCIQSCYQQDLELDEFEVIAVNDGSTDGSEAIIDKYCAIYPNLRKVNQQNMGISAARNTGLDNASGTYMTYLDSDDFFEPHALKEILDFTINNDYDIVNYNAYRTYDDHRKVLDFEPDIEEGFLTPSQYVQFAPSVWNKITRTSLYQMGNIRFPVGIVYEDFATAPLLVNVAKNFYYLKKPVVNYYMANESITRSGTTHKKWSDFFKAIQCLEGVDQKYYDDVEFIIYLYLLYRTNIDSLSINRKDEIKMVNAYVREKYPTWKKNPYVKQRPFKERFVATLFYHNMSWVVKLIQKVKRAM